MRCGLRPRPILSPFQFTFGMAENAVENGVEFFCGSEVTGIASGPDGNYYRLYQKRRFPEPLDHQLRGTWSPTRISAMLGIEDYTLHPCRGEYFVLDKKLRDFLPLPVYPVPNYRTGGLGIHLTPTLDGNILVGPSTEYISDRGDYSTTRSIMDMLIRDGSRIFPYLSRNILSAALRESARSCPRKKKGGYHDFVIERRADIAPHAINLVGNRIPGAYQRRTHRPGSDPADGGSGGSADKSRF